VTRLPRTLTDQIEALKELESASLQERKRMTQVWAERQLNLDI